MSNLPAIVKLGTREKALGVLGMGIQAELAPHIADLCDLGPDSKSIRVHSAEPKSISSSAKKSESIDGSTYVVNPNQAVKLNLPTWLKLNPSKYRYLISPNPELLNYGQVSGPGLVPHHELVSASLLFSAIKKIDLEDLPWIFDIVAID